jgi:hypothetical protein
MYFQTGFICLACRLTIYLQGGKLELVGILLLSYVVSKKHSHALLYFLGKNSVILILVKFAQSLAENKLQIQRQ